MRTLVKGSGNSLSECFMCLLGVRQGESLSPFLFGMFINDLETYLYNNTEGDELGVLIGYVKICMTC